MSGTARLRRLGAGGVGVALLALVLSFLGVADASAAGPGSTAAATSRVDVAHASSAGASLVERVLRPTANASSRSTSPASAVVPAALVALTAVLVGAATARRVRPAFVPARRRDRAPPRHS